MDCKIRYLHRLDAVVAKFTQVALSETKAFLRGYAQSRALGMVRTHVLTVLRNASAQVSYFIASFRIGMVPDLITSILFCKHCDAFIKREIGDGKQLTGLEVAMFYLHDDR